MQASEDRLEDIIQSYQRSAQFKDVSKKLGALRRCHGLPSPEDTCPSTFSHPSELSLSSRGSSDTGSPGALHNRDPTASQQTLLRIDTNFGGARTVHYNGNRIYVFWVLMLRFMTNLRRN
ncbi:hypothetical protein H696_00748 [Fonticula alba]|uniref:Uncharacterized protein n=1 Tax=Fonticula alba TaxID=691883 RepID=A0A058ZFN8_FONAL|nr:hypothetical protein H696_00748 [Fonticula alba]KCV73205.1 hypothetical protein H696_00748 [Fonticula alba]|eukprot:XP_009492906.1 hypothetical protein H696_00748 [Fonticula alba]